jgi:hypothetical protein
MLVGRFPSCRLERGSAPATATSTSGSAPPESFSPEHAMAVLDDVVAFLQGGLEALRKR